MAFKRTIFLLVILFLGMVVDDAHGKEVKKVVNLGKDSFNRDVAAMPHFVRFCVPW